MGSRSRRSSVGPTALSLSNAQRRAYSPSNAFLREAIDSLWLSMQRFPFKVSAGAHLVNDE